MRLIWLLLAVALLGAGCSSQPDPSSDSQDQVESSYAATAEGDPLDGTWTTGPVPIADIKAAMLADGASDGDVEAWLAEVGSPAEYSFKLNFAGGDFTHSEETPDMAMQVGESGTYLLEDNRLVLTLGEADNVDTYTFAVTIEGETLTLDCLESTEQGTAEDKAKHHLYTIAFYCSAPFSRQ